jgi:hypothetical protein
MARGDATNYDPIAETGFETGSGFDGRYDRTKPWQRDEDDDEEDYQSPAKWTYTGPWASNMERLTQQALMAATMPGTQLQQLVRPVLPQVRLFPDRIGYGSPRLQPSIEDVISVDRVYTDPRVSWYSGSPAGYSGSSRNDLGAN